MNSFGKIADIFIMIMVMFIFPVSWTLTRTSIQSGEGLWGIAQEFMERTDSCKYLDTGYTELIGGKVRDCGDYVTKISIVRRSDGCVEAVFNDGFTELNSGDIVILKISDRYSTVCSYIKVIT